MAPQTVSYTAAGARDVRDQRIEQFALPCPNYIKIDVPTAAGAILEGARRTLMRPEVKEIHAEIDADSDSAEVLETLTRAGFEIAGRSARKSIADVTFVKRTGSRDSARPRPD